MAKMVNKFDFGKKGSNLMTRLLNPGTTSHLAVFLANPAPLMLNTFLFTQNPNCGKQILSNLPKILLCLPTNNPGVTCHYSSVTLSISETQSTPCLRVQITHSPNPISNLEKFILIIEAIHMSVSSCLQ